MPDDTGHGHDDCRPLDPSSDDVAPQVEGQAASALAEARGLLLGGCGLLDEAAQPAVWRGAARWAVLETGFGHDGLHFFATWAAWRQQAQRPARLFYTAVMATPPEAQALIGSAARFADLAPRAAELAAQWHGLVPGVHRLRLDGGRVQLTLAIGDVQPLLTDITGEYDSIFLDRFEPDSDWGSLHTLKSVARLARHGTRVAAAYGDDALRERLAACGFNVGADTDPRALRATYAPRWTPRSRRDAFAPPVVTQPARCAVVGAGLAGAAVARALAQRGWQVTVLDRTAPAAGASGLPAGVVAAHVSPDDRPLSRLTRAGVRATLAAARALLSEGRDFGLTGVLERHAPGERRLPDDWNGTAPSVQSAGVNPANATVTQAKARAAHVTLDAEHPALWHAHAGWLRPAALVQAMLQTPGVRLQAGVAVHGIDQDGALWQLRDDAGGVLAEAELVVITAGFDSLALLGSASGQGASALPLHALRGQVAWAPMPGGAANEALPRFPVNGLGSLIAHVPGPDGPWWITGSTFERGNPVAELLPQDHAHNRQRLAQLLPAAAAALQDAWDRGDVRAWAAVRATLPDRLPAVGAWWPEDEEKTVPALAESAQAAIKTAAKPAALPLHLLTGLGARGLTLSLLAADILAAWLHAEPLPVERSLAQRLRASRWQRPTPPRA